MLEEILRAVFGAFFGAIGFAMLVHTPRRALLVSGLIASFAYMVYWSCLCLGLSDHSAIFLGSLFGSLAGQLYARKMKIISTIFLMSAVVPVVPGLGLYRMMSYLGRNQLSAGAGMGISAMITIGMISLGLGAGTLLAHYLFSFADKKQLRSADKKTP